MSDISEVRESERDTKSKETNRLGPQNILVAPLVAQMVKCLPAMQETWVQSPGQEDPLEKEVAALSSTLAWKIPWTEGLLRAW